MPRIRKSENTKKRSDLTIPEKSREVQTALEKYENDGVMTIQILKELKTKIPFKSAEWIKKTNEKSKEKQHKKNLKQLIASEMISNCIEGTYTSIEACKSLKPPSKYCDFTGLKGYYKHKETGLRYNSPILYQEICKMPLTIVNNYLEIRKAIVEIK